LVLKAEKIKYVYDKNNSKFTETMSGRESMFQCEQMLAQAINELNLSFPGRVLANQSEHRPSDIILDEEEDETQSVAPPSGFLSPPRGQNFSLVSSSSEEPGTPDSKEPPRTSNFRLAHFFSLGDSPTKQGALTVPLLTAIPPSAVGSAANHGFWQLGSLAFPVNVTLCVTRIALEPVNAKWLAAGTISGALVLWRFPISPLATNVAPEVTLNQHNQGISALLWTANGGDLVSASIDETLVLWKPGESSRPVHECRVHASVSSLAMHPKNPKIFIAASVDGSIRFYSLPQLRPLMETVRYQDPLTCISVSPDGCMLAAGSSFGILVLFSLQSLRLDAEIDCRNRRGSTSNGRNVVGLDWSLDSQYLCVSSLDSRVRVVHLSDLSRRTKFKCVGKYVNENLFNSAVFVMKERRLLAVSSSGHICGWEVHGSTETNDACSTCYILAPNEKTTEITASQVFRHLPMCLVESLKVKHDHGLLFAADTLGRIQVLIEFHK
jgi:WD40 repeat protein